MSSITHCMLATTIELFSRFTTLLGVFPFIPMWIFSTLVLLLLQQCNDSFMHFRQVFSSIYSRFMEITSAVWIHTVISQEMQMFLVACKHRKCLTLNMA